MSLEHHSLVNDFPEHAEKIHELKIHNKHFSKLFEEYHQIDKQVYRIESGQEPTTDIVLEEIKKNRLLLKDQLFEMIKA